MTTIRAVFLENRAVKGPGGQGLHWVAWREGDENGGPRGWGDTRREAELDLTRAISNLDAPKG